MAKKEDFLKSLMRKLALCTSAVWVLIFGVMSLDYFPSLGFSNTFTVTFMNGDKIFDQKRLDATNPSLEPLKETPVRPDAYFVGWYSDTNFTIPFNAESLKARDTIVYAEFKTYTDTITEYVRANNSYCWTQAPLTIRYNTEDLTTTAEYISLDMLGSQVAFEYKFLYDICTGNGSFVITLMMDGDFNGERVPPNTVIQSVTFTAPLDYSLVSSEGTVILANFETTELNLGNYLEDDTVTVLAYLNCRRVAATTEEILLKHFLESSAGTSKSI